MSVWRIVMKNSCIYEIRYIKLIHESGFLFKWKIRKKKRYARDIESYKWHPVLKRNLLVTSKENIERETQSKIER